MIRLATVAALLALASGATAQPRGEVLFETASSPTPEAIADSVAVEAERRDRALRECFSDPDVTCCLYPADPSISISLAAATGRLPLHEWNEHMRTTAADVNRCFLRIRVEWDGRISSAEAVRCRAPIGDVRSLALDLRATVDAYGATPPPWLYIVPLDVPLAPGPSLDRP